MFDLSTLAIIFLQFLVAGSCFYLVLCVDPHSSGILGKAHRFIFNYLPSYYNKMKKSKDNNDKPLFIFRVIDSFIHYICNTNHPLVQVFYVIIAGGGFCVYWYFGLFRHFPNSYVSGYHIHTTSIYSVFCFYTYYLVCSIGPGRITKDNLKEKLKDFDAYYDDVLFEKSNKCITCNLAKPARSKHCKTCNMCVSRFDHHCIWIRQCVGEENYKYFLLFIGSHAILTLYGSIIGMMCLYGIVVDSNLLIAKFRVSETGEIVSATWGIIFKFIFYKETMFVFMVILCLVMGITLTIFLVYHFTMVRDNMTTNERVKRSDYIAFIERELIRLNSQKESPPEGVDIKDIEFKIKKYSKDLDTLKKWFPNEGFLQNLLRIINA